MGARDQDAAPSGPEDGALEPLHGARQHTLAEMAGRPPAVVASTGARRLAPEAAGFA